MSPKSLFVVMDATGKQWLCPSRPILVGLPPDRHWEIKVNPNDSVRVSRETGCIKLWAGNGIDRSLFDGKLAWRIYGVRIAP